MFEKQQRLPYLKKSMDPLQVVTSVECALPVNHPSYLGESLPGDLKLASLPGHSDFVSLRCKS